MNGEGCWSTVVCTPSERAALGLTGQSEWLLHCRLVAGHLGNHATDASSHPRVDRRLWLEWNDFDDYAQSLIERNPCAARSPQGTGCLFYEGHGGGHFFAPSNGHAPTAVQRPPQAAPPQAAPPPGGAPQQQSTPGRPTPRPPARPPAPPRAAGEPRPAQQSPGRSGPMRPAAPRPSTPAPADHASGVRREATAQPVGAHAGRQGYRLGRRSTDAAPPADMTRNASSRHRLPEPDDPEPTPAPTAPAVPAQPPREAVPGPNAGSGTGRASGVTHGGDGRDAEIAAALREVAVALEKLASAMRPPEGPTGRG
ncbi:MAG: hypothetical protein SW127_22580 [Actinomycetota bacterium]|nr:hypothetical protein [Actinomycetota bacterium]